MAVLRRIRKRCPECGGIDESPGWRGHNERYVCSHTEGEFSRPQMGPTVPLSLPTSEWSHRGQQIRFDDPEGARRAARERLCIPEIDKAGVFRRARVSWCGWYEAH